MTVTTAYEIEFDGTKIANADNREIIVANLFESPEIRTSDKPRGQLDGLFPGTDYYGGKTITVTIEVVGTDETDFYDQYIAIRSALRKTPDERVFEIKLPGWPDNIISNCRVRKVSGPIIDQQFDLFMGRVVVQLQSTDPRLYGATEQSSSTSFVGVQSGRTYNLTFDRSFGGVVASNSIFAVNQGNYETPWRAVINGPVTNPSIEHVGQGKTIQLIGSVATGEFLEVSSPPFSTIMLGGTATRYSWLANSENWFMLDPGTNEIRFNGSSAGAPTLDFYWRSAWV